MNSEKHIEDYLLGQLPLNERITFESEIQENPALRKKVEQFLARQKKLEDLGRLALLDDIDEWRLFPADKEPEKIKKQTKKEFTIGRFTGYLLVLVIIIFAAYLASRYDPIKSFSSSRAYSFYFEPVSVNNIFTDDEYNYLDQNIRNIIENYANKEYDKALSQFQSINDFNNDRAIYLIEGISHLEAGHLDSAIHKFRNVSAIRGNYKAYADWYLALAYIKKNELEKSKDLLLDITDEDGPYHAKAMELLKILIPLTASDAGQRAGND